MPGELAASAEAQIDLAALRANYAEARRLAGARTVIAVVKAQAYGHGALPVARTLAEAGCERFAVACVGEGVALRDAGLAAPILVFGGARDEAEAEAAVAAALTPAVHAADDVERLARAARGRSAPTRVHVEVDTGMQRLGAPLAQALALCERAAGEAALRLEGVYTHFARADEPDPEPSLAQLRRFDALLDALEAAGIRPPLVHVANSPGLLAESLRDALPRANAVRPGVMLYGVRPAPHLPGELRPVMTLRCRVATLRDAPAGSGVGYGALYRAERDTRIATLPLGYADGVPIAASNRGEVLIRGRRHRIVGRVSMDAIGVDVGTAPVEVGDEALLFGAGAAGVLPVEEAALAAGTIPYELLVRVGERVPRRLRE